MATTFFSISRESLAFKASIALSAVVFGAVCAHWYVQIRQALAPQDGVVDTLPAAPPVAPPVNPANLHLFGLASSVATPVAAAPPPNLILIGVIASPAARGAVALLTVDGKSQALRRGDPVSPGITLQDVQADHVVLDQQGRRSELALASARGAGPSGAAPPGARAGAAPATPPGQAVFHLDVQSLGPNHMAFSKAELSHGLQDPKAAAGLGRAEPTPGGGLKIDDVPPGSLPDRIGLHTGDVLKVANGQALNALTDLPRLYQEFGTASQVRLEIVRDGQPMSLQYTVKP